MTHKNVRRAAVLAASSATGLVLLTGCSSSSSSTDATSATPSQNGRSSAQALAKAPASGASTKPSAAGPLGECTDASLLAALPAGSTMDKRECAVASGTMWAAARVKSGSTVYFLQTKGGPWKVSKAKDVCGSPSARLPQEIKAYCTKA